jgi:hypothetical protein
MFIPLYLSTHHAKSIDEAIMEFRWLKEVLRTGV